MTRKITFFVIWASLMVVSIIFIYDNLLQTFHSRDFVGSLLTLIIFAWVISPYCVMLFIFKKFNGIAVCMSMVIMCIAGVLLLVKAVSGIQDVNPLNGLVYLQVPLYHWIACISIIGSAVLFESRKLD